MKRIILLLVVALTMASCQFEESMVLNEDGSGRMSLKMDLGEMMAMTGEFAKDSTMVKTDTIVGLGDILKEKKDSIAKLPKEEQARLMAMKDYKLRTLIDAENGEMLVDLFVDFKDIAQANKLFEGFGELDDMVPAFSSSTSSDQSEQPQVIGVKFSFTEGVFKRDAFIIDPVLYEQQLDSIAPMEAFLGEMKYNLKYTFPKKIKTTSNERAIISEDGKTLSLETGFIDYFKNPDMIDVEVILEKK